MTILNSRLGFALLAFSTMLGAQNAPASCSRISARLWAKVIHVIGQDKWLLKRVFPEPTGLWNAEQAESLLVSAKIINTRKINLGKTGAVIVDFEGGLRGIFKSGVVSYANNYRREIAAYRLDRILGLDVVPPTIVREIEGQTGSLQLFVENATVARLLTNEDNLENRMVRFFFSTTSFVTPIDTTHWDTILATI